MAKRDNKKKVLKAFLDCFTKYSQVIFVNLLNISTPQIIKIRQKLHKENGTVLVGKNSITRLAIKMLTEDLPASANQELKDMQKEYKKIPHLKDLKQKIKNKVAFVFVEKPYVDVKDIIEKEIVQVPAKAGVTAPNDVWVRAGQTNIDPGKFNEFMNLNIPTKTAKNALEIQKDTKICSKGEVVSETIVHMCKMLDIVPFTYGMTINDVYLNKQFIPKEVIDMPADGFSKSFENIARELSAVSLEAGLINELSAPHVLQGVFKSLLAIAIGGDVKLPAIEELKKASAAPAPAAAKAEAPKDDKAKKPAEKPKEEPKIEEEMDLGGMFD